MKTRFNEVQIIGIMKEQENGHLVTDICRRYGIAQATEVVPKIKQLMGKNKL